MGRQNVPFCIDRRLLLCTLAMPSYKLTYFDGRGRGEISRMLFAAGGKPFVDDRISFDKWGELKPKTPQGTLPVLEVDEGKSGKWCVTQSTSVARYLAREFCLCGKGAKEMATADMILDTVIDLFGKVIPIVFNKDEAEKAEKMKEFKSETAPKILGILEKLVSETGKGGFAVGSNLTLGDLSLFVYLENCGLLDDLDKFPLLSANRKKVAAVPRIKEYLSKRKETPF